MLDAGSEDWATLKGIVLARCSEMGSGEVLEVIGDDVGARDAAA